MRHRDSGQVGPTIQRPSRALALVMLSLVGLWLAFAISINWGPFSAQAGSKELFRLIVANRTVVA